MSRFDPSNIYHAESTTYLSSDVNVIKQHDVRPARRRPILSDSQFQDNVSDVTSTPGRPFPPSSDCENKVERVLAVNLRRRSHIRRRAYISKSRLAQDRQPSAPSPSSPSPIVMNDTPYSYNMSCLTPLQVGSWRSSEPSIRESNSSCSPLLDANTTSTSSPSDVTTPIQLRSPLSKPWMSWDITESKRREDNYYIFAVKMDDSPYGSEPEDGRTLHRQNTAIIVELLRQRRHKAGLEWCCNYNLLYLLYVHCTLDHCECSWQENGHISIAGTCCDHD